MSLDVVETIKSTFSQFKSEIGLKILGAFLLVNLVTTGLSFGLSSQGIVASFSFVGILLASIASIVLTVGAFRSLFDGSIEREQFTEDLVMPFLRNLGSGAVTALFTLLGLYIALVPAVLIGGSVSALSAPVVLSSLSPALIAAVIIIGGTIALYPLLALLTSTPMIFVERDRMFEALDKSVQRSRGEKLGMFLATLPVGLLYLVAQMTALAGFTGSTMTASGILISSIGSSVGTLASISLLVEYHRNLPEA